MTNQEKFVQTFGKDVWLQMIVSSGLADQFKEFWTSPYTNKVDTSNEEQVLNGFSEKLLQKVRKRNEV